MKSHLYQYILGQDNSLFKGFQIKWDKYQYHINLDNFLTGKFI